MHSKGLNISRHHYRYSPVDEPPSHTDQRLLTPEFIEQLRQIDHTKCYENVDLSHYTRWRIGGTADCVVCPRTTTALRQVLALAWQARIPVLVVGLTTNLLFSDAGIHALVIHLGQQFATHTIRDQVIWAQAGLWVPAFARKAAVAGFTGMEHLAGIPGTLGGLICMNGGSQRKGIGEYLLEVTAVDREGNEYRYHQTQCHFGYRQSIFQYNDQIITDATFAYPRASDPLAVRRQIKTMLEQRRRKFPQKLPNCGSVFVSDPALYADAGPPGAVIERCGLKGLQRGGAQVSPLHANFIINTGAAATADVLFLIDHIRTTVWQQTGHDLVAEVKYVDPWGQISPAHVAARQWMEENLA